MGRHEAVAMGRHEAVAMGRPTDLVLDASLPKHKKLKKISSTFPFSTLVPFPYFLFVRFMGCKADNCKQRGDQR